MTICISISNVIITMDMHSPSASSDRSMLKPSNLGWRMGKIDLERILDTVENMAL